MLSPRRLAGLTAPVLAGVVLLTNPGMATADTADDAYLARLHTLGLTWPADHDVPLTTMGRLICDDIAWGYSYDQIAQGIHPNLDSRKVSLKEVASMVSVAHSTYCPDVRAMLSASPAPVD